MSPDQSNVTPRNPSPARPGNPWSAILDDSRLEYDEDNARLRSQQTAAKRKKAAMPPSETEP